jgi:hypothetical protein
MSNLDQEVLNILYTPLDIPEPPKFDYNEFVTWVTSSADQQVAGRRDASKITDPSMYPWDIVYAKLEGAWHKGFDQAFPDLAKFFSQGFNLEPDHIKNIILLPVKEGFIGTGFWHSDPDESGLRLYLENEETDNFLLIRPTVEPLDHRPPNRVLPNNGIHPSVQNNVEHSARLLKPNQGFFINNIRGIHAARTNVVTNKRIAVIISLVGRGSPLSSATDATKQLIINSAKKYSDYSIYWTPPR